MLTKMAYKIQKVNFEFLNCWLGRRYILADIRRSLGKIVKKKNIDKKDNMQLMAHYLFHYFNYLLI